ncbi:MAG: CPBP family intramembrane glutamic endopeptidase [Candidatus Micrarchaeota archaeon]
MGDFVGMAASGKNDWWRYLASFLLILFLWLIVGSVPFLLVLVMNGGLPVPWNGEPASGPLASTDPFVTFYLPVSFSFLMLAAGVAISVKFIHGRSLASAITSRPKPDMQRVAKGFALFIAMNAIATLVSFALEPSSIKISIEPLRLLIIAPLFIALTALQTTSEEMLFRGYLLQGFGNALKKPLLAAVLSSFIFVLAHMANPETSSGLYLAAAYYFAIGFWLCLVTLKDGGAELAIGAHAANNMFILLVNYETSALEIIPSVFKATDIGPDDLALSLAVFVVLATAAYALLFRRTS